MKNKVLIIVAALALVVIAAAYWMTKKPAAQQGAMGAMPPAEVAVITATPETVSVSRELPGRTSAYRVAQIRPQVSGIIIDRMFTEGSNVKEGQQLYQIDPAPYQAAYDSAAAALQKAEANILSVQAKAERYAELVKAGAVSKQDHDDASASYAQAKAEVAVAKAALTQAKINLQYTKVLSPVSGRIGKSSVTEGALVTANQADPLATVQQLDRIYVDLTQSAEEVMKLKNSLGSKPPVELIFDSGDTFRLLGHLQFSDVTVDETTGMVTLRALFDNPEMEILPGLFVRAKLVQSKVDNAILIPQQSVVRNADGSTIVFKVGKDNVINPAPVKVSAVVGDKWLVDSGISAGDVVMVEGLMKIQAGATVKPVPFEKK
ncbi:efflux RND transporter periplasmic adaptor subunit [Seleniivibrio woodruffii]|uniref:Membrane fusion protein (Multidrug efflux system) n=1 Tax=Seleniivibrio woodruffii TaxID=1078050 RepID=A0A4R1KEM7_9BACT|nr:efflux RND transporter periplasmic adaptor subunit [Seleniivibrio woodruffii]TCK62550.1 membrane fusion protein (multidrug efflux system) [Seleniivibrio woodruffii]TVZ37023.1 membrane fusion protein (multidrug efflux system) [Seleniivibrio woodruffii]